MQNGRQRNVDKRRHPDSGGGEDAAAKYVQSLELLCAALLAACATPCQLPDVASSPLECLHVPFFPIHKLDSTICAAFTPNLYPRDYILAQLPFAACSRRPGLQLLSGVVLALPLDPTLCNLSFEGYRTYQAEAAGGGAQAAAGVCGARAAHCGAAGIPDGEMSCYNT